MFPLLLGLTWAHTLEQGGTRPTRRMVQATRISEPISMPRLNIASRTVRLPFKLELTLPLLARPLQTAAARPELLRQYLLDSRRSFNQKAGYASPTTNRRAWPTAARPR